MQVIFYYKVIKDYSIDFILSIYMTLKVMKRKTPRFFATNPSLTLINTLVAVSAATGIASKMIPSAHASEKFACYNLESQKTFNTGGIEMTTYNTVSTQSFPGLDGRLQIDDSTTTTDNY